MKQHDSFVRFWPVFLVTTSLTILESIQMLLDEVIISDLFGDDAFSAINLLEPYMMLVTLVSYLICGGLALIVQAKGRQDLDSMRKYFCHSVTTCILAGAFFSVIYYLFDEKLVHLVAGKEEVYSYALHGFLWDRWIAFLQPINAFLVTFVMYFVVPWLSFITVIITTVTNVVLSYYLGQQMGIEGVTCASFIAEGIGFLLFSLIIFHKMPELTFRPYINPSFFKETLPLGIPESSLFLAALIFEAGFNALALEFYSVQGVAVISVVINIYTIVVFISEGISEYETLAINYALGEKNGDDLQYGVKITFRAVYIEGILFSLLFLFAAPWIADFFDIDDASAHANAVWAIRLFALAPLAIIITRVTVVFGQYTGRILQALMLWIFSLCLIPLLLGVVIGSVSLALLVLSTVLGPVITVIGSWVLHRHPDKNAAVDMIRTKVVFGEKWQ